MAAAPRSNLLPFPPPVRPAPPVHATDRAASLGFRLPVLVSRRAWRRWVARPAAEAGVPDDLQLHRLLAACRSQLHGFPEHRRVHHFPIRTAGSGPAWVKASLDATPHGDVTLTLMLPEES